MSRFHSRKEAESLLLENTGRPLRVLFLLTNAAYWLVVLRLVWEASSDLAATLSGPAVCENLLVYVLFALAVATASTFMHAAQLRLLPCSCLHHYYTYENISFLKRCDWGCALSSLAFTAVCKDTYKAIVFGFLCAPFFAGSVILKRTLHFRGYIFCHSCWHLLSAFAAFYLFLEPFNVQEA